MSILLTKWIFLNKKPLLMWFQSLLAEQTQTKCIEERAARVNTIFSAKVDREASNDCKFLFHNNFINILNKNCVKF